MNKLQRLTQHLIDHQIATVDQIEGRVEQGSLSLHWKPGPDGLHLGDLRYRAVIELKGVSLPNPRLLAFTGSWLENHDVARDQSALAPVSFRVQKPTGEDSCLSLELEFIEQQYLSEQEDGEIEAFGKRWGFEPFDLWEATEGHIVQLP